ncbi:MAG: hypothetical protein ACXW3U_15860 [Rhodoplanes sp.]
MFAGIGRQNHKAAQNQGLAGWAWGTTKGIEAGRGRPKMNLSATRRGWIKDTTQINTGGEKSDMALLARGGTIEKVEQRSGEQSGKSP